ncbi:MAG: U32 family peptidase [Rikenellaceae bacterium]
MREIELLAPAKNYDAACAAVDHGADAVYIGGAKFGARVAAGNDVESIARVVEYAHKYGVRIYATLNTLLYEGELREAEAAAREIVAAGVDALIVQDMAYARMNLGAELHASTQMCNMTGEGVKFLEELGFSRVVLERNLSLHDIARIRRVTDVELEAFVHGAICVGYSGRCLLSRSMSPRSGNRGECSQPCRLSYDLVDRAGKKIREAKHLLSVKDLNLTTRIGELIDSGVNSLKIEGRLKELSYTKNIVAHYRRAVDEVIASREGLIRSSSGVSKVEFEPNPAKSFSRGETIYLFDGKAQNVASFETPKALGEYIGEVSARRAESFKVRSRRELATGDGICYLSKNGLVGSNINRVERDRDGDLWITLNRSTGLDVGTKLHRNFDRLFEASVENSRTRRTIEVDVEIESRPEKIEVRYRDIDGYQTSATIEGEFEQAKNLEKMRQVIAAQLSKCGDTVFEVKRVDDSDWGGEFIASSQLATLRRDAMEALLEKRVEAADRRERKIFVESPKARYPKVGLGGEVGVTNSLAETLYRDHGVKEIAPALELQRSLVGEQVMESSYCIRGEIGECLRRGTKLRSELFLERGNHRYRLKFDCTKCRMSLIVDPARDKYEIISAR